MMAHKQPHLGKQLPRLTIQLLIDTSILIHIFVYLVRVSYEAYLSVDPFRIRLIADVISTRSQFNSNGSSATILMEKFKTFSH